MKKSYLLMAAMFVCVFAASAAAQKLGGYKEISASDAAARAAAEFAVSAEAEKAGTNIELVSVHKAERQSVQGTNYRLCLKITTEGDDAPSFVQAIVYVDPKGEHKLVSWTTSDCGGDDDN